MAPKRARLSRNTNETGTSHERWTAEEKGKAPVDAQANEENQVQAVAQATYEVDTY